MQNESTLLRYILWAGIACMLLVTLSGCFNSLPSGSSCKTNQDCFQGEVCREGTCQPASSVPSGSDTAVSDVEVDSGGDRDVSARDAADGASDEARDAAADILEDGRADSSTPRDTRDARDDVQADVARDGTGDDADASSGDGDGESRDVMPRDGDTSPHDGTSSDGTNADTERSDGTSGDADASSSPAVDIVSPTSGAVLSGNIVVEVEVRPGLTLDNVALAAAGSNQDVDTTSPYEPTWQTTVSDEGPQTLKIIASPQNSSRIYTDTVDVVVDNTAPSLTLETPVAESQTLYHGAVPLEATASDNTSLQRIEAVVDPGTSSSKTYDLSNTSNDTYRKKLPTGYKDLGKGKHDVEMIAEDAAGLQTTVQGTFVLDRTPNVTIQSPSDGETLTQAFSIDLQTGDDIQLTSTEVQFANRSFDAYASSKLWRPDQSEQGTQTIVARVTDSRGQTTTKTISVTIDCSQTWYRDDDGDGRGAPNKETVKSTCEQVSVYPKVVDNKQDCDDSDPNTWDTCSTCKDNDNDGYYETCNRYQNIKGPDCDDSDADINPGEGSKESDPGKCYEDQDGDGYGDISPPSGVAQGTDCLDSEKHAYPGAAEKEQFQPDKCRKDVDQDGYGDKVGLPPSIAGTDCDDSDADTYPGAAPNEANDGCYRDADGDGYGDESASTPILVGTDCNDSKDYIWTTCQTCDDGDNDGWYGTCDDYPSSKGIKGPDCDDSSKYTNPDKGTKEMNSGCYKDRDGDGYGDDSPPSDVDSGSDCFDANPSNTKAETVNPDQSSYFENGYNENGQTKWDYNCKNGEEKKWTNVSGSCPGDAGCNQHDGWDDSLAGCGQRELWTNCKDERVVGSGTACRYYREYNIQKCR